MNYGISEIYKMYKEEGGTLSRKDFSNVLGAINKSLVDLIYYENFHLKLPFGLGVLCIYIKKNKLKVDDEGNLVTYSMPVNWRETLNLWEKSKEAKKNKKLIFHTNKYIANFTWDKRTCNVKNQRFFYFKTTKPNRARLAELLRNSDEIFYFENPYKNE
jgi:hypothetical protein